MEMDKEREAITEKNRTKKREQENENERRFETAFGRIKKIENGEAADYKSEGVRIMS